MKGRITTIKRAKGFGFIRDEAGTDRFFHANEVRETTFDQLHEGLPVVFEPHEEPGRGQRAVNVRVAG